MNTSYHSGNLPVLLLRNCMSRDILGIIPCITNNTVTSVMEVKIIKLKSKNEFIFSSLYSHCDPLMHADIM